MKVKEMVKLLQTMPQEVEVVNCNEVYLGYFTLDAVQYHEPKNQVVITTLMG